MQRPWNYLDSLSTERELMMSVLPANLQGCHEIVGFCELQSIIFVSWYYFCQLVVLSEIPITQCGK